MLRIRGRAFTLIELVAVISIILIITVLVAPAFTQLNAARSVTKASYDIAGLLEEARAYAKANDTYTWVGFYEEDGSQSSTNPATAGTGRVIVSVVASRNATALYGSTDPNPPPLPAASLTTIGNLVKIDNTHLTVLGADAVPSRGKVPDSTGNLVNVSDLYQVGDTSPPDSAANFTLRTSGTGQTVTNATTFNYPLSTSNPTYTFVKIIQFNPLGDATKIVDTPTQLIEIGLRSAHGSAVAMSGINCAAVQVGGISGQVRIYRP